MYGHCRCCANNYYQISAVQTITIFPKCYLLLLNLSKPNSLPDSPFLLTQIGIYRQQPKYDRWMVRYVPTCILCNHSIMRQRTKLIADSFELVLFGQPMKFSTTNRPEQPECSYQETHFTTQCTQAPYMRRFIVNFVQGLKRWTTTILIVCISVVLCIELSHGL